MALTKVTYSMIDGGIANVTDFGAVGDGVTDDKGAFDLALASGAKQIYIPAGSYYFATAPVWTSVSGVTFVGDAPETTLLKWDDGTFAMKSMSYCTFRDVGFYPTPSNTLSPVVKVSNFTDVVFDNCIFRGFGGSTANKSGSTCVYMLCSDTASSDIAAGSSEGAMFLNCRFIGDSRKTNFAIRVHNNNFTATSATNTGAKIIGCSFGGFNWNAVELAGTTVYGCVIEGCVANVCGLQPFDIDKGAHSNTISNCIINRLLGNVDLVANPNTRTAVAGIQGYDATTGYAYGNTIKNMVAYLKKSDLDAYGNGCAAASVAYAQNNVIDGVTVYCDGVPVRGSGPAAQFGLACVAFETAAGNQIRNVLVTNATCGIRQTQSQNAAMTSVEPNIFENIKNIGTLTEECISISRGASSGAFSRNICKNVSFATNLTNPYDIPPVTGLSNIYAVHAAAYGSSSMFFKLQDSYIGLPANSGMWFMYDAINNVGLQNVVINDNGAPYISTRFVNSEGSTVPETLAIENVTENFGRNQIDLASSVSNVGNVSLIGELTNIGLPNYKQVTNFASSQPSAPAAPYWNSNFYVEKVTKTSGSTQGWVSIGGSWKQYGSIT